jgi:hypothetical protein
MLQSKDDFNLISATTSEQRGQSDRTTATQAQISNQRSELRENHSRARFAKFLCSVAKEVLYQMAEKLTDSVWIKRFADSDELLFTEVQQHSYTWEQIMAEELEGNDFDLNVSVTSLSPIAQEEEKKKFFEILAVFTQYPMIGMNPYLVEEAFNRIGYRNEKVKSHFQQMAMLQMIGATQMMQAQSGIPQQNVQESTPDTQEKVNNQLTNQVGRI